MVKYENINDKKIEIIFNIDKCALLENIIFFNPKIDTAPKVGIESKKEILDASNLLKFNSLPAVIVIPDLLTPGIRERI